DTHGYFHPAINKYFDGVSLILHAGDVGAVAVLDELERISPVVGVYGNVDGRDIRARLPEHQRIKLDGLEFWMTHIGGRPGRYDSAIRAELSSHPPDVFICGHSHILQVERDDKLGGMLFINPGAAGRQGLHRVKTCIRVDLVAGSLRHAEVIHLDDPEA
ncbi:MAG: metallophosphatase family protein, partial [Rhodothermia bacterium]|nr:metallophosphatase family protein [Rhodothermia bacterium]